MADRRIQFLSWGCPWPAYFGGSLRTLGLLRELGKRFDVDLIVMWHEPPDDEQMDVLRDYVRSVTFVPMRTRTWADRARILREMALTGCPYHCAVIRVSFAGAPGVLARLLDPEAAVYASYGNWGTLVRNRPAPRWVLDQHNADIDFWRVYAGQAGSLFRKAAALVNWKLAAHHFPAIYRSVGRIVSVCGEDRLLTHAIAPDARIDVVENGVDCVYFSPERSPRPEAPQILFTGTSAPRNVTALRWFVREVFPSVREEISDAGLLVAGNFSEKSRREFADEPGIRFTGKVDDIRPFFNGSDVFIAPFSETHGSKLKIAEAMAMGMPIVSTPEGIRGFSLVECESVLIARSAAEFARHTVTLLRDDVYRRKLGLAARRIAEETVDWHILGDRLARIAEETMFVAAVEPKLLAMEAE